MSFFFGFLTMWGKKWQVCHDESYKMPSNWYLSVTKFRIFTCPFKSSIFSWHLFWKFKGEFERRECPTVRPRIWSTTGKVVCKVSRVCLPVCGLPLARLYARWKECVYLSVAYHWQGFMQGELSVSTCLWSTSTVKAVCKVSWVCLPVCGLPALTRLYARWVECVYLSVVYQHWQGFKLSRVCLPFCGLPALARPFARWVECV